MGMGNRNRHSKGPVGRHLTYANVMSTLFVFLLLAGGTALAAKGLAKNSVGPKQLKANAVTTAKIKKAAVTKDKLAAGSVTTPAIADGSVTGTKLAEDWRAGADIAAGSTPFSQIVAKVQNTGQQSATAGSAFTI